MKKVSELELYTTEGKEHCDLMKKYRAELAAHYDIPGFEYQECKSKKSCPGFCMQCDKETRALYKIINKKRAGEIFEIDIQKEIDNIHYRGSMMSPELLIKRMYENIHKDEDSSVSEKSEYFFKPLKKLKEDETIIEIPRGLMIEKCDIDDC